MTILSKQGPGWRTFPLKDANAGDDPELAATQTDPGPAETLYVEPGPARYLRFRLFWTDANGVIQKADMGTYSMTIYDIDRSEKPARVGYYGFSTENTYTGVTQGQEVIFGPVRSGVFAFRVFSKLPDAPDSYLCQVYVE